MAKRRAFLEFKVPVVPESLSGKKSNAPIKPPIYEFTIRLTTGHET